MSVFNRSTQVCQLKYTLSEKVFQTQFALFQGGDVLLRPPDLSRCRRFRDLKVIFALLTKPCSFFFYAILRSSFSLQKTTRALVCENIVWFKRYFDVNPIVWGVRETRHNVEVKSYKVVQVVRRMSFTRLKLRYILNWSLLHFPGTLVRFRRELKNVWDGVSKNNAIEHLRCWCTRFEDTRRNLKIPNLQ